MTTRGCTSRSSWLTLTLLLPLLPLAGCARCNPEPATPQVDFAQEAAKLAGGGSGSATSAVVSPGTGQATGPFVGAGALLPKDRELSGWTLKEGPERYDASRLYEAIDGGADRYLSYGFEELARATYAPSGIAYKEEATVEVYQMASPLAAYGIFSVEAVSCDPPAQAPGPGCSRRSDRVAHRGKTFVKVTTYADTPEARQELTRLTQSVLDKASGEVLRPAELDRLPAEAQGTQRTGQAYLHEGQTEFPGLGAAFRAEYGDDPASRISYYLRQAGDAPAATALSAALSRALSGEATPGNAGQPIPGVGEEAQLVTTADGVKFFFRQGLDVGGGAGFKSAEAAIAGAKGLAAALGARPAGPGSAAAAPAPAPAATSAPAPAPAGR